MAPNVLLIILDSVRARNTGLHGHVHETTPFLQEFAADSATLYEQARAPGARSITSHASIFTGLAVEEHGITSADTKLQPGTTIFERLRDEHGYETGVFSENVWITDVDIGLKEGFETVEGPQNVPYPDALDPRTFVAHEGKGQYRDYFRECLKRRDAPQSIANGLYIKIASDYPHLAPTITGTTAGTLYRDLFSDWLSGRSGPWAACINLMDAHRPYTPSSAHNIWGDDRLLDIQDTTPGKWELSRSESQWWERETIEHLYDGAIHQTDAILEDIIGDLERLGVLDDTLVVITSDHGEGFGEPSRIRPNVRVAGHNVSLHEVLTHVPLVVKFPGQTTPSRIENAASVTRFPRVVDAALEGQWSGDEFVPDRSVVATTYGLSKDSQLRARALRYCDEDELWEFDARTRAVYEDEAGGEVNKYMTWRSNAATIRVRDAQVSYRLTDDGRERVEEAFKDFDDAGVRTEGAGIDDVDGDTYQRLEDLGYV